MELDFNDLGGLVTGRLTGPEIQTAVTVDPDVALDVAAFVAATCRAAGNTAPVDGLSHEVLLPLVDEQHQLTPTRRLVCEPDDQLWLRVLGGDADAIVASSEGLRVPVWFESSSQPSTTITSIRAASTRLDVVADALPIEVLGGMLAYAWTFVTWRVQDSTAGATLDYDDLDVVVSGTRAGRPPTESTVALDPDLALDTAAYVSETCSER